MTSSDTNPSHDQADAVADDGAIADEVAQTRLDALYAMSPDVVETVEEVVLIAHPQAGPQRLLAEVLAVLRPGVDEHKAIADAIARGKAEILADIEAGVIPSDISTFERLHDFVDANEYGGLTDGSTVWGRLDPAGADIDLSVAVQNALDTWLASDRPTE
jgi:hypothetical protein